jgi:hypothetical protein
MSKYRFLTVNWILCFLDLHKTLSLTGAVEIRAFNGSRDKGSGNLGDFLGP